MQHKRQTLVDGWNQEAIRNLRALVAGAGALGSQVAISLTRLGVGRITLIDPDTLEEHNLENQVYDASDIGKTKVGALRDRMKAIEPSVDVRLFCGKLEDYRGEMDFDVLLGCFDNVAARYWLNFLAVTHKIPYIDSGILGFLGNVTTILPGRSACYMCAPLLPANVPRASCSENPRPTTYVAAAFAASLQVTQLIKLAHKEASHAHIMFDLSRGALHRVELKPNPDCELCGVA